MADVQWNIEAAQVRAQEARDAGDFGEVERWLGVVLELEAAGDGDL